LPGYTPSGAEGHIRYGQGKLTKIEYWFHTTKNDKDWDTEVVANIVYNGRVIAGQSCCGSDHNADHWNNRSNSPRMDMPVAEQVGMKELSEAVYKVGIRAGRSRFTPNGNDKWEFDGELRATFSDNRHLRWSWQGLALESKNSNFVAEDHPLQTAIKDPGSHQHHHTHPKHPHNP
jgi:hypothetical protein